MATSTDSGDEDVHHEGTVGTSSERAGKWSAEEENLANHLISDFEDGSLDDCENGTTLRSYLARKLNCAPMRISKKFAGRCIGKVGPDRDEWPLGICAMRVFTYITSFLFFFLSAHLYLVCI